MSGPGCEPWCVDHDGAVCRSEILDDVMLTSAPGERPTVWIQAYDDPDKGLSFDDAERAARAILALLS